MVYAEVAVDAPAPEKTYTYLVPPTLRVSRGQTVWVPLGRESRLTQGFVFGFSQDPPPVPDVKSIYAVIEAQPMLSGVALDLAWWLSDYYFAPLFECAALMMPAGFRQRIKTSIQLLGAPTSEEPAPSERFEKLLALLASRRAPVDLRELRRALGPTVDRQIEALVRDGHAIRVSQFQRPTTGPKYQRRVALTGAGADADLGTAVWARRPKQREVLELLRRQGPALSMAEIKEEVQGTLGSVSALARGGFVTFQEERVIRDPLADRSFQTEFAPMLTPDQQAAWEHLALAIASRHSDSLSEPARPAGGGESLARGDASRPGGPSETSEPGPREGPEVFLLHGVTGSGKTELYLKALEACVARGKRGIVLVPEIALEPQTVARFSGRFPGRVAVLHSGLSPGEAYDEWWRIKAGEFDVVIGPRSAIFAPQPDLGLIVIDEEHEPTYKQQEPAPRYHARRVAYELARRVGAVLLLGSATPDLESYVHAQERRYHLLTLPERVAVKEREEARSGVADRGLPSVEVVDLREELRAGNHSIFSRALQAGLAATLQKGQQAILFLNRRGTATFVQCRDCGAVVRCRRCETPLTYHSAQERLLCHQCNAQRPVPQRCSECDSTRIKFLGVGTQRVQHEVEVLFPQARVLRWDRDVTRARHAHQELLERFTSHEADVLVGTQMVAKGLDLPRVTLVGVVNADVNLYLPDFRAAERTFQLLTQVAGRAGRGPWAGAVIFQTYTPEHYAIAAAARVAYGDFFQRELAFRQAHGYPPFQPLIRLLFADVNPERTQREATAYARALQGERARAGMAGVTVQGPVPAYLRRVRGRYRWLVMLKGPEAHGLLQRMPPPRGWLVDVDPLHIL